jgi:hypothetical protein
MLRLEAQPLPAEKLGDFQQQISAREYLAAAQTLQELKKSLKRDLKLGDTSQPTHVEAPKPQPQSLWADTGSVILSKLDVELSSSPNVILPAEVPIALVRTEREIRRTQFWQTVLAGAIVLGIAYTTYQSSFVGTCRELIAIFFWAFSTDLAVTKVLDAAKAAGKS